MNIENYVKKVEEDKSINHKRFKIEKKEPIDDFKIEMEEKRLKINFPNTYKDILKKWGYWKFLNTELIPLPRIKILDKNFGPLEGLIPFARIPGGEILAFKKLDSGDLHLIQYHPRSLGFAKVCETFEDWLELLYDFIRNFDNHKKTNKHKFREVHEEIKEASRHWRSEYPTKMLHILKPYLGTYVNNFPAILLIIYIVGFLIFTSHLFSYGISDLNLLNFNFLKSGIVFTTILLPLFGITITALSRAIEDYMPINLMFVLVLVNSIFYVTIINSIVGIIYTFFTRNPYETSLFPLIISTAGMLFFMTLTYYIKDVTMIQFPKIIIFAIVAIIYQYFLLRDFNEIYTYLTLYIIVLNVFLSPDMILILEEKFFGIASLLRPMIYLIIAFVIFGFFFYKIIPSNIGGGQPIFKRIIIDKTKIDTKAIDKSFSSLIDTTKYNQEIIYENSDMYYLKVSEKKIIGINREFVIGEVSYPFKFPREKK